MPTFTNIVTGSEHAIVARAEDGIGVHGTSNTSTGTGGVSNSGIGVHGVSTAGPGVRGDAENGVGVFGGSKTSTAVGGMSDSGIGVHGISQTGDGVSGTGRRGVVGESQTFQGVFGRSQENSGVVGESDKMHAVFGITHSTFAGVFGVSDAGGTGLAGESNTGIGVHGKGGRLAGLFEGDVEVTGDIRLSNADCAEDFDVAQNELVEPGTVMILGDKGGALHQSRHAYDKRVAGVISGAGSYKPGIVLDRQNRQINRVPLALLGKVYCKVDSSYAPVEVGDLLTTSDTPGHAMKATDPLKAFGSIIGKALQPLKEGQSLVPVLIALQ